VTLPLPLPRSRTEIAPGAVHVPDWLTPAEQRDLLERCRAWAAGPVPMAATRLPSGGVMSVRTVCLGWHWSPYRYTRTARLASGATVPVAPFPAFLTALGRRAVAAAYGDSAESYGPDAALINFYDAAAKMGLHQDKDERSGAPVVSLSLGDSCVFRFGNPETRGRPWTDVQLHSGDLVVFGGESRFAYHGVPKILPGTSDLLTGRLNITLRETGLQEV
jgi:alkylated DNA repair protein (DNA oxidative demethylase)